MIEFEKIQWKNFFSTGAAGIELQLNKYSTSLFTGKNGAGKSTLNDAICYVLFNKAFRKLKLGQLINSINTKQSVVSIEFKTNGRQYKVIRGQKPAIFEIYEDGELYSKVPGRDYQKILEQQILKFNFKTFTQIVILGTASFVPFMKLPAAARREVIEDILDIGVFSSMNEKLKKKFLLTKSELTDIDYKISADKAQIDSQEKLINVISNSNKTYTDDWVKQVSTIEKKVLPELTEKIEKLSADIIDYTELITDYDFLTEKINKGISIQAKINNNIDRINDSLSFFTNNDCCPTCSQDITSPHKATMSDNLQVEHDANLSKNKVIDTGLMKLRTRINEIKLIQTKITETKIELQGVKADLRKNTDRVVELNILINKETENVSDKVNIEKIKLDKYKDNVIEKDLFKAELLQDRATQEQALQLLKDTGIKTSIIREYLPIINSRINKFLQDMDFFCNFEIDETFNERILSRHRDDFSYESFSEGERQRIDLAIIFTFREISQMKNSLNTNLLILDEIFSSSLEAAAVTYMVEMLTKLKNTQTIIITHSPDAFIDEVSQHMHFTKKNEFSTFKELK